MKRTVIQIDEALCNGCGICVNACHEGAIGLVNGKAKLLRDDFCDGMGDCLPECPTGAISFIEREAAAYDEAAVKRAQAEKEARIRALSEASLKQHHVVKQNAAPAATKPTKATSSVEIPGAPRVSRISQWPIEIKLISPVSPAFEGAHLLVAADCTAFAYANFHEDFMKGKTTIIGCPKLDGVDYSEKLADILMNNDISEVTVARMEVPCCGGLDRALRMAVQMSGKQIPVTTAVFSTKGDFIERY